METTSAVPPPLQIGILTRGKPTLAATLTGLLLQDARPLRVHIVDTGDSPAIRRDDVAFALRLAHDREILCEYEVLRDRQRPFSIGRLRLLEVLDGPHVGFMDDDIAVPSQALARLQAHIVADPDYGYCAPICRNMYLPPGLLPPDAHWAPGAIFRQDERIRSLLIKYYSTTTDLVDSSGRGDRDRVWEIAFLSYLFPALGRSACIVPDSVVYHLDYSERPDLGRLNDDVVRYTLGRVRALAGK